MSILTEYDPFVNAQVSADLFDVLNYKFWLEIYHALSVG